LGKLLEPSDLPVKPAPILLLIAAPEKAYAEPPCGSSEVERHFLRNVRHRGLRVDLDREIPPDGAQGAGVDVDFGSKPAGEDLEHDLVPYLKREKVSGNLQAPLFEYREGPREEPLDFAPETFQRQGLPDGFEERLIRLEVKRSGPSLDRQDVPPLQAQGESSRRGKRENALLLGRELESRVCKKPRGSGGAHAFFLFLRFGL
jgi:hypothetical protein